MKKRDFFRKINEKHRTRQPFENNLFKKENSKWSLRKKMILIFFLLISIAGFLFYIFFSNQMYVQQIYFKKVSKTEQKSIEEFSKMYFNQKKWMVYLNRHIWFFSTEKFTKELQNIYAYETIEVSKFKNNIEVYIEERKIQYVWSSKAKTFAVDKKGIVIKNINETDNSSLKIIDRNQIPVQIGKGVLSENEMQGMINMQLILEQQNIEILQFEIDRLMGKWFAAKTKENYLILFDPVGNVEKQGIHLMNLLKEKITDTKKLEYIDLRFGDRVYFK